MNQWTLHPSESNSDTHSSRLKDIAASFKLLADETRLRVLSLLIENGELNVRSLCERLDQSQPAVSHHLALLREAGLICARRDGKHNFYRCIPENMDRFVEFAWRDVTMTGEVEPLQDVVERNEPSQWLSRDEFIRP